MIALANEYAICFSRQVATTAAGSSVTFAAASRNDAMLSSVPKRSKTIAAGIMLRSAVSEHRMPFARERIAAREIVGRADVVHGLGRRKADGRIDRRRRVVARAVRARCSNRGQSAFARDPVHEH